MTLRSRSQCEVVECIYLHTYSYLARSYMIVRHNLASSPMEAIISKRHFFYSGEVFAKKCFKDSWWWALLKFAGISKICIIIFFPILLFNVRTYWSKKPKATSNSCGVFATNIFSVSCWWSTIKLVGDFLKF